MGEDTKYNEEEIEETNGDGDDDDDEEIVQTKHDDEEIVTESLWKWEDINDNLNDNNTQTLTNNHKHLSLLLDEQSLEYLLSTPWNIEDLDSNQNHLIHSPMIRKIMSGLRKHWQNAKQLKISRILISMIQYWKRRRFNFLYPKIKNMFDSIL